jgi:hypothetical protein
VKPPRRGFELAGGFMSEIIVFVQPYFDGVLLYLKPPRGLLKRRGFQLAVTTLGKDMPKRRGFELAGGFRKQIIQGSR